MQPGDRVEVLWLNNFSLGGIIYGGRSWWQASIVALKSPNLATISFTDWGEVVDVNLSMIRAVRCTSVYDLTCTIEVNAKIEVRCSNVVKPEIWLESIVTEVVDSVTFAVQRSPTTVELMNIKRAKIRPALEFQTPLPLAGAPTYPSFFVS
jgi:hypothetical protein